MTIDKMLSKNVYIKSYGCQMNVYDSDRMADILFSHGYKRSKDMHDAHVIILNTCHVREKATEKVYSDIGRIAQFKKAQNSILIVAGCVGQAEGNLIIKRAPSVDFVVGPQSYHHIPRMLMNHKHGSYTEFETIDKFDSLPHERDVSQYTAFVPIQEGCDKFCTFCVVPYTRGPEFSRPPHQILDEIKMLLDKGVKEITLLGQNVNGWTFQSGDINHRFSDLLSLIDQLPLSRLRYMTSHPKHMTKDLIDAHVHLKSLMPWLHLPVQSGSDRILKKMNRGYTKHNYYDIIQELKDRIPDMAFSSDFIVGFPTESPEDFKQTLDLVHHVNYAAYFALEYSLRPGTPAALMNPAVSHETSNKRLRLLIEILEQMQKDYNETKIGQKMDVLIEKTGKYPEQLMGRSKWMQPVLIQAAPSYMGQVVSVDITHTKGHSLFGTM